MILEPVSQEHAARAFELARCTDPEGKATAQSMAYAGQCLRVAAPAGELVLSIGHERGALWVYGAAGKGQGMTATGLQALEYIARAAGLGAVAFQTMRRGLIRQAKAKGYEIAGAVGAGYILQKKIA